MPVFRSYSKSEDAYADAAFLGGMGLDAIVIDESAFGGNLLGASSAAIRIEMPEEQMSAAEQLLAQRVPDGPAETPAPPAAGLDSALPGLLRGFLLFDIACCAVFALGSEWLHAAPPPAVEDYLRGLAFSEALWGLAYISHLPMLAASVIASLLCLFWSRAGRTLYAVTLGWAVLSTLGPPPLLLGPLTQLLSTLHWAAASMALALMFWSPLRERFRE